MAAQDVILGLVCHNNGFFWAVRDGGGEFRQGEFLCVHFLNCIAGAARC
jgi:hypothetical protein